MSVPVLERLKLALSSVKASISQNTQIPVPDVEPEFSVTDDAALLAGFRGWTNLTLRGGVGTTSWEFRAGRIG